METLYLNGIKDKYYLTKTMRFSYTNKYFRLHDALYTFVTVVLQVNLGYE